MAVVFVLLPMMTASPTTHTIKMNVSDVYESPLPAFFFLEGPSEVSTVGEGKHI